MIEIRPWMEWDYNAWLDMLTECKACVVPVHLFGRAQGLPALRLIGVRMPSGVWRWHVWVNELDGDYGPDLRSAVRTYRLFCKVKRLKMEEGNTQ